MRIGIIGATDVEINILADNLRQKKEEIVAGKKFYIGKIFNNDVFIVNGGAGKVNSAITTQILIERYKADSIISSGLAIALDCEYKVFDLVIATDLIQYDLDATCMGCLKGEIPNTDGLRTFRSDDRLTRIFMDAQKSTFPNMILKQGRIATGDTFVHTKEVKDNIKNNFSAVSCDMEGCAIAQTCFLNKIPVIVLRSITDDTENVEKNLYDEFEIKAAKQSSSLMLEVVGRL